MLRDWLIPDIWCCDSHRYISYLILICIYLIPDTWYLTLILDMLYLTFDIWHQYLTCYHLNWYCDTWLDIITPETCITLHIHDYHFHGDLDMIIILLPNIWYSWTPVSRVLMSPALLLLLIAQSYRRPAEHAWCRDNEDVSHDHTSVRRILNGTKCHTEQSATPYTWWGLPLESVGATSWIWGTTSWIHFPHKAKCHTEQSVTPYTWWGPPLESVGLPLPSCLCRLVLA